jgi:pyruvate dehydrogenase E2 component (dihydrolipoamide acetyltransferase)
VVAIIAASIAEVRVPDIGDFKDIPVIEVLVKPGATVSPDDPIVTLESDKATLDVPAQFAGRVISVEVLPGSRVSCGTLLLKLERDAVGALEPLAAGPSRPELLGPGPSAVAIDITTLPERVRVPQPTAPGVTGRRGAYAGPSVRRMARELAVDLEAVSGTGPRGRIIRADVVQWVQTRVQARELSTTAPASIARAGVDFSKFGAIERIPLKRVSRISAEVLARNWSTIPHVTNFEDADVTELDAFRQQANGQKWIDAKLTLTVFMVKACAAALVRHPQLNVSLDGGDLIQKKYVHIGVAVDAKDGLVVPVLRDVDKSALGDIAVQLVEKVELARSGKLKAQDMQGGSITISSLGSTGGRHFTPIINAPEVAIVGLGKTRIEPRWNGEQFVPRQILPISLSWDHRALDGVTAARFLTQLIAFLEDFRRVLL